MTLAVGASAQNASNFANTLTTASVTTAASGSTFVAICCGVKTADLGATPITDNMGNTWPTSSSLSVTYNSSTTNGTVWILPNGVGGAGHTMTIHLGASIFDSMSLFLVEITATSGYAVLDQSGVSNNIANATIANSPAITPAFNGEVVLSVIGIVNAAVITLNDSTGFNNIIQSYLTGTSNTQLGGVGATVQSTAGTLNDIFTIGTASNVGTMTMSFKPNAAVAAPAQPFTRNQFFVNDIFIQS